MNAPLPADGVDRLVRLFGEATPAERTAGLRWYADAHAWADGLATRYGVTVDQVAGITAALSPQTSWPENQRRTELLLSGRRVPGFRWGRDKAERIRDGESPAEVLSEGRGPKSLAFYDNISRPTTSDTVTIDRHAVHAYLGMILDDNARGRVLNPKGNYERIADAYRHAAARVGVRAHVLQAVVWLVWRNRYGVSWLREDYMATPPVDAQALNPGLGSVPNEF